MPECNVLNSRQQFNCPFAKDAANVVNTKENGAKHLCKAFNYGC
jgi:hypothetical protein